MKIAIASDHRGVKLKAKLTQCLRASNYDVTDSGTDCEEACDYPDFACIVAQMVSDGTVQRGILICGTGIGMSIVANKFSGVRAASCWDEVMVEYSRRHNDVNVLCLPGDLIGTRPMEDTVLLWLRTEFEGGRHRGRVDKIIEIERDRTERQ